MTNSEQQPPSIAVDSSDLANSASPPANTPDHGPAKEHQPNIPSTTGKREAMRVKISNGRLASVSVESPVSGGPTEEQNAPSERDFYQSCASMNELHDHLPTPPDGGYGWVIVAAAFVSNFVVDGVANSFSPFMNSYQKAFDSTKAATSLIGSILIGSYLLSGPLAGGLLNRFEARKVVIGGALLSALAIFASTLSPNLSIHCILYGLLGGVGFGFIYLPAIVVVSQYFEYKRALATGVAVAGSGFGTFVMPVVCKVMIETIGWKLALCVVATLILACCIGCGLLYRPLPVPEFDVKMVEELKKQALMAALSRAEGTVNSAGEEVSPSGSAMNLANGDVIGDGGEENADDTHEDGDTGGDHVVVGDTSNPSRGTSPYNKRVERLRISSECTSHDGQPLLLPNEESVGSSMEEAHASAEPSTPGQTSRLSPIQLGGSRTGNKARGGSLHQHHQQVVPTSTGAPVVGHRVRQATITSMNSELTTSTGELGGHHFHCELSHTNLASSHNLARVSARSYAQSLSRIGQVPSIRAGESVLSIAMSGVDPKEFSRPMARRDTFLQGSIRNLREFAEEGSNYKAYRESQLSIPMTVVAQSLQSGLAGKCDTELGELSSRIGGSRYSRITGGGLVADVDEMDFAFSAESKWLKWIPLAVRNTFGEMTSLTLLKEPVMLLLCCSNILGMLGFYVPFVYIIDLALSRQSTEAQATILLSIIGITNTFGRVFFGWIADRRWLTALSINNGALLCCGVLTCLCPLLPNYWLLCLYAALFGFIVAYICLTSIVLSDLLGVENLTNSFGLLVVSRGVASLLGTPLAGIVYDSTSSYDASFVFAGLLITLSGVVSCLIPTVHRYERSQLKNEGDYNPTGKKDIDSQSIGKLSVLTERSEENYQSEYQRTIQSILQQRQLLSELEAYKGEGESSQEAGRRDQEK